MSELTGMLQMLDVADGKPIKASGTMPTFLEAVDWKTAKGDPFSIVPEGAVIRLAGMLIVNRADVAADVQVWHEDNCIFSLILEPALQGQHGSVNVPLQLPLMEGTSLKMYAGATGVHYTVYGLLEEGV